MSQSNRDRRAIEFGRLKEIYANLIRSILSVLHSSSIDIRQLEFEAALFAASKRIVSKSRANCGYIHIRSPFFDHVDAYSPVIYIYTSRLGFLFALVL